MPNELTSDIRLALTQIENALVTCRVAERAASDVEAALKRIDASLKSRPQEMPARPLDREPLAVSREEAARLLCRSRNTIYRLIRDGRLELNDNDQITLASLKRIAAPKVRSR